MANRRGISVKGLTYQRVKDYCGAKKQSMSGFLEEIIAEKMDAAGVPIPEKLEEVEPKTKKDADEEGPEFPGSQFTF